MPKRHGRKKRPATWRSSARPRGRRTRAKCCSRSSNDVTADRNYIREFILARRRALGQKHGFQYAEAYHYIEGGAGRSAVDEYIRTNAIPAP
jgi:hypothetical protein